jgi:hypothetical protein
MEPASQDLRELRNRIAAHTPKGAGEYTGRIVEILRVWPTGKARRPDRLEGG